MQLNENSAGTVRRPTILVVNINKGLLTSLSLLLEKHFKIFSSLSTPEETLAGIRQKEPDILLWDVNDPALSCTRPEILRSVNRFKKDRPQMQIVLIINFSETSLALEALGNGATDYIVKPWNNERLLVTLLNTARLGECEREIERLERLKHGIRKESDYFWGISRPLKDLRRKVQENLLSGDAVLITGNRGTGKKTLAKHIHALSSRQDEPLVIFDVETENTDMFEAALSGYGEEGLSGTKKSKAGKLELAHRGTLLLLHVDRLDAGNQKILLKFLKTGEYTPLGGNRVQKSDFRFLCTASMQMEELVQTGAFDAALYNRIGSVLFSLPDLTHRKEDLLLFSEIFLHRYCSKYNKVISGWTDGARRKLADYSWPGNLRELDITLEKAVLMCREDKLSSKLIPPYTEEGVIPGPSCPPSGFITQIKEGSQTNKETQETEPDAFSETKGSRENRAAGGTLRQAEMKQIENALEESGGNITRAAQLLGISRPALYHKARKYGILR